MLSHVSKIPLLRPSFPNIRLLLIRVYFGLKSNKPLCTRTNPPAKLTGLPSPVYRLKLLALQYYNLNWRDFILSISIVYLATTVPGFSLISTSPSTRRKFIPTVDLSFFHKSVEITTLGAIKVAEWAYNAGFLRCKRGAIVGYRPTKAHRHQAGSPEHVY